MPKSPIPREHGAWAMLLQPFAVALLIYHRLTWAVAPAAAAVVLVFLIRDPVTVLARDRWVRRGAFDQTAIRYAAVEALLLAVSGGLLLCVWPLNYLIAMAAGAGALMVLAVWMTVNNRRRAIWFQVVSAAGLCSSGLAACLAVQGTVPVWGWWIWGLFTVHCLASILVVHARLEARIVSRKGESSTSILARLRREATVVMIGMIAGSVALAWRGRGWFAGAMAASAVFHLWDLYTLDRSLSMPIRTVGFRALGASMVFAGLLAAGAWGV